MCDGSALTQGKPLHDDACWFRVLTNEDHVTRDGTVHYQALKGAQFSPADPGMPWDHELSGRALCLAGGVDQIAADAAARIVAIKKRFEDKGMTAPSKIKFVGVASATAVELRQTIGAVQIDTAFTPYGGDDAHSDIITVGTSSDADLDPVRSWLMDRLRVTAVNNLQLLLTQCGSAS